MNSISVDLETSLEEFFYKELDSIMNELNVDASDYTSYYLMNLLLKFNNSTEFYKNAEKGSGFPVFVNMLERALNEPIHQSIKLLKRIGDLSLYITGFFSDSLTTKLMDVSYYIAMGETAYNDLSYLSSQKASEEIFSEVYDELALKFTDFVSVFNEISEQSELSTNKGRLRLYERWLRTGDERLEEKLRANGIISESTSPEIIT